MDGAARLVARARHPEAEVVGRDDHEAELREQCKQRRRACHAPRAHRLGWAHGPSLAAWLELYGSLWRG